MRYPGMDLIDKIVSYASDAHGKQQRSKASENTPNADSLGSGYSATVRYLTNRKPGDDENTLFGSERERSQPYHYGEITVELPIFADHKQWEEIFTAEAENESAWAQSIIHRAKDVTAFEQEAATLNGDTLVYIHGYNTNFREAVKGLLQWACMANFTGNLYLFSWPSLSRFTEYAADKETAVWSSLTLSRMLDTLRRQRSHRLHIVAHSMGSVALMSALQLLPRKPRKPFANIILAAPDLDAQFFQDVLWPSLNGLASGWSVYYSETDVALMLSRKINTHPRLGSTVLALEGVDFIDASNPEINYAELINSHAYHERKHHVVKDILRLIKGRAPHQRALQKHPNHKHRAWKLFKS